MLLTFVVVGEVDRVEVHGVVVAVVRAAKMIQQPVVQEVLAPAPRAGGRQDEEGRRARQGEQQAGSSQVLRQARPAIMRSDTEMSSAPSLEAGAQ